MKTIKILYLLLCLISIAINAQTIHVVSNLPTQNTGYTTLQEAVDAANTGDIIMLQPSPTSYGNATINKTLEIIGAGYFKPTNPEIAGSQWESTVGNLEVEADGTIIKGLNVSTLNIKASNTLVTRSLMANYQIIGSTDVEISNNILEKSYVNSSIYFSYTNFALIKNCFINSIYSTDNDAYNVYIFNNIIAYGFNNGNSITYSNNIVYNSGFTISGTNNNAYNNNICAGGAPNVANNVGNVDMSTVFVGYSDIGDYSADTRWQLIDAPTNPAKGGGENDEDCGMYGGDNPYIPSGIPDHPEIYSIYAPAINNGNSGMNVEIKARTNN